MHDGQEEQQMVLPRRVPLAALQTREEHLLHRPPHQEDPHAQAHLHFFVLFLNMAFSSKIRYLHEIKSR